MKKLSLKIVVSKGQKIIEPIFHNSMFHLFQKHN